MITVKDNKLYIPVDEAVIGHVGDNLNATREFFFPGVVDISLVFRVYLMFDDGSSNFFLLDSEVRDGGTLLTWNVTNDQIYKSGIVKLQIKASNSSGIVFHTEPVSMLVQTSIEFAEVYSEKDNSEFLQHEKKMNEIAVTARSLMSEAEDFRDSIERIQFDTFPTPSSNNAVYSGGVFHALSGKITNGANTVSEENLDVGSVTTVKIADGAVTQAKLAAESVRMAQINGMMDYTALSESTTKLPSSFAVKKAVSDLRSEIETTVGSLNSQLETALNG